MTKSTLKKLFDEIIPHHIMLSQPDADKDMQKVLDVLASLGGKPIEKLSPEEARLQPTPTDAVKKILVEDGKDPSDPMGIATRNIMIPGTAGAIPARIYTPESASATDKLPVVLYFHGGGWVIADLDVYDATPRSLSKALNAIVVSSHYRQAPEHRFPAAHEDAFSAYSWLLDNVAELGGDASRIGIVGESAGGNLAINTVIAARDKGFRLPNCQVLVYPVAGTDTNTESYQQNAEAKPLNKPMMEWFMKHVINGELDKQDPRLDLIGHGDVAGLPATTIVTAEIDPLRSDGELLAAKLRDAGVKTELRAYDGVAHEFFGMALVVSKAKEAQADVVKDIKSAF